MGGGGKGGGGASVQPQFVDPVNGKSFSGGPMGGSVNYNGNVYGSASEALNAEIADRQAQEKTASDTATATATDKAAKDEADFQSRAATAKSQATDSIQNYFTTNGVDPSQYAKQIGDTINTASGNIADLDPTPQGKYAPTLGSDLFNQLTAGKQSTNLAAYNKVFDPSYSLTAMPGTMVDPSVSSVVNSQFDPLTGQLSNAQKRGTLNDQGYAAALQALNTAKTGATASVNKLATGVLNSDRSGINDYINTGRSAAGSAPLNTAFSTDPYVAGAQDLVGRDTASFGGDVQNAVGATKFSDLTTLLNAGGSVQGAFDPTAANPNGAVGPNGVAVGGADGDLSASAIAQQALANDKRGLGTTGAF
jgi:hypothetical protein